MDAKEAKGKVREKIWREMKDRGIARFPLPCKGRIPNFNGAEKAAEKLRQLGEWKKAKVIFVNPDSPQKKVREIALKDGKMLIMASPRLKHGFILITPEKVKGRESFAATIRGAFMFGSQVKELLKPDLVVTGSVAVDIYGHRLGKGHGYGDQELRMVRKRFGEVPVATTVHDIQVLGSIPFEEHDEKVDLILTPTKIIKVKSQAG